MSPIASKNQLFGLQNKVTSRRHIQGSKIAKGHTRVNLQYSKIEKEKKWTEWRAKRGTLPKLSTFLSQLKGGPFGEKTNFRKKVSQCRKTERGALWGFSTSILSQNIEKLKGEKFYFRKKISQCQKKLKGGTPWDFPTSILTQNSKKIEGGTLCGKNIPKKSLVVPKKMKGGTLWSRPVWYVTRKTGKTFLVQFARPNGAIWCNNILYAD